LVQCVQSPQTIHSPEKNSLLTELPGYLVGQKML